jgi:hypothetical protein
MIEKEETGIIGRMIRYPSRETHGGVDDEVDPHPLGSGCAVARVGEGGVVGVVKIA